MTSSTPLAVFDLDGTLVCRDSFLPFLWSFAVRRRYGALPAIPWYCGLYVCKILSDRNAKERLLRSVFRAQPQSLIADHAEWFCDTWLQDHWRPSAVERVRFHQRQGHRVILLSASPDLYVPQIARRLDISEVICTRVAAKDGCCTGNILGENCKGEAKLRLLRTYLGQVEAPPNSAAYGDQSHDLHLLRWVSEGYLWDRKAREFKPVFAGVSSLSRIASC
jgi:phosphatidylglycerophosphatase C